MKKSVPILGQDEEMLGCHSSSIRRVIIKYVPRRGKLLVVTEPVDKPVNYLSESCFVPHALVDITLAFSPEAVEEVITAADSRG
ncbi:MAG: hypothetical protein WCC92_09535 [Candidatus Korobacteraceae bacterium]